MKPKIYLITAAAVLFTPLLAMAAEEAGGAEAPVTPFAGTIYQSIAAIIVFVLLMLILRWKAWGPILKGLQNREEKIKSDLERAEADAKAATATLEDYRRQLASASAEARKIIEQGRADAQKVAADLQAQAHAEIESARKRAHAEIDAAREQAVADIYTYTASLATDVAGKILKREIRPDDQRQLIDDSVAEFKRAGASN